MKKIRFRIQIYSIALFSFVIFICSCNGSKEDSGRTQTKVKFNPEKAYVCTGPTAKRYHATPECMGLSRCSDEVIEVTAVLAEENGMTPCRMCMSKILTNREYGL